MSDTENKEKTVEEQLQEQFKDGLDPAGAVAMATELHTLRARVTELEGERDQAKAEAADAKKAAKVTKAAKPAKPRTLKPLEGEPRGDDLVEAIANAKSVEIAFSDGKREIAATAPYSIEGDAWVVRPNGLMLDQAITLHGPAVGEAGYQIDGYALILDGEQVAYSRRSDPLSVTPGGTFQIKDDVIF